MRYVEGQQAENKAQLGSHDVFLFASETILASHATASPGVQRLSHDRTHRTAVLARSPRHT